MRDRLVLVPDETRQRAEEVLVVDDDFVRVGLDGARDLARVAQLAVRPILESDGEGLERPIDLAGHDRGNGAAVQPAGQEHAERDIGHEPDAHGFFEQLAEPPHGVALREARDGRIGASHRNIPVASDPHEPVLEHERVPRHHPMDALEEGAAAREGSCAELLRQLRLVCFGGDETASEDGFDFGSEEQPPVDESPVERLHAETIAREEQPPARGVPDGEREHAPKPIDTGITPLLVGMDDGLGVGAGSIAMARLLEFLADGGVVVDLAVEHDPDRLVFVGERLMTGCQVHDAQPSVADRCLLIRKQPGIVRAPVGEQVAHISHARALVGMETIGRHYSRNSAHRLPGPPEQATYHRMTQKVASEGSETVRSPAAVSSEMPTLGRQVLRR